MRKHYFIIPFVLMGLFLTSLQADNSYDNTTKALNNSAEENVRASFRELLKAYTDGDSMAFFDNVSEDNFQQDYIGFDDAIREDFRMNSILNIDYVFNQMVPSGKNKYFLFVQWEKLYQNIKASQPQRKRGTSRFIFQKVNSNYKLIGMSGKILFGDARKEWKKDGHRRQSDTPRR